MTGKNIGSMHAPNTPDEQCKLPSLIYQNKCLSGWMPLTFFLVFIFSLTFIFNRQKRISEKEKNSTYCFASWTRRQTPTWPGYSILLVIKKQ